jgi:hypothetical protein
LVDVTVTKPPVTAAPEPDVTKENGRPSLGPKAMTGAERMRKLRAKAKALKRVAAVSG